jgi:hypothetical protein
MSRRVLTPPWRPSIELGAPPADLLRRIESLRQRFVSAEDLTDPFHYFDEHVACSPDLLAYSDDGENELLLRIVCAGVQRVRPTFELLEHTMLEVRGTGFWHGMGNANRGHVYYYYFAPIGMGLVGHHDPLDPRGESLLLRFSAWASRSPVAPCSAACGLA